MRRSGATGSHLPQHNLPFPCGTQPHRAPRFIAVTFSPTHSSAFQKSGKPKASGNAAAPTATATATGVFAVTLGQHSEWGREPHSCKREREREHAPQRADPAPHRNSFTQQQKKQWRTAWKHPPQTAQHCANVPFTEGREPSSLGNSRRQSKERTAKEIMPE